MTLTAYGVANPSQGLAMLQGGPGASLASREDTVSQRPLRRAESPSSRPREVAMHNRTLDIRDIDGAVPAYLHRNVHKFAAPSKEPIPGNAVKILHRELNGPKDFSLTTSDIPGAQPDARSWKTGRRVNPLTPRYDLPSCRDCPATPPPPRIHQGEVWDSMAFKGETKSRIPNRDFARNPNETRDIEHSQPSSRCRTGTGVFHDTLRTIEHAGERVLTTKLGTPRFTCPLDPVYTVPQQTTHPNRRSLVDSGLAPREAGRVHGSTPRVLHPDHTASKATVLVHNIPEAVSQRRKGAVAYSIYDSPEVTPFARSLGLDCSDIPGAQTGTRRQGAL